MPRLYSLHGAGLRGLRNGAARRAAFRLAAARGRSIALMYHRVTPAGAAPHEVPPNVSVSRFREHLQALGDIGDIVPLSDLLHPPKSHRRVRIAITFDDDDTCHVDHALPALMASRVQATFFLSGRVLHGLGAYWWMLLERLIVETGIEGARRALGIVGTNARELGAACEGTTCADRLSQLVPDSSERLLGETGFQTLAAAGMQIGFHTLHHPVLTTLRGIALDDELRDGRSRLAEVVGMPVDIFAYPHGRTNARVAERVRAAGYRSAFRTGARAISPGSDPFMLARLGPGSLPVDDLLALIALKLSTGTHPTDDLGS